MAETTGISWCDATFNPWIGCEKVSPGCAHCYAETLVTGRMGRAGTWGADGVRQRTSKALWLKPVTWAARARMGLLPDGTENLDDRRPRIFCASLADVFEPRPELDPWRNDLFDLIQSTPELDWLVLTKRPDVARDWLKEWYEQPIAAYRGNPVQPIYRYEGDDNWHFRDDIVHGKSWAVPPNLWIGTSVENSRFTWRVDWLRRIPARVRFISAEPLLGSLFEDRAPRPGTSDGTPASEREPIEGGDASRGRVPLDLTGIDWVIVGGESGGRSARPMHPTWAKEIRDAVLARAIPDGGLPHGEHPYDYGYERPALHFKQWGSWVYDRDRPGVLLSIDGRTLDPKLAGDLSDHGNPYRLLYPMRYAGAAPTSGGHLLDGVSWREFPDTITRSHQL